MSFKPSDRRLCMNCAHFRGDLSHEETKLVNNMLQHYKAEMILDSWIKKNQLKIPGGHRIDQDKARVADILRRQALCRHENVLVSAIDVACYAFKPNLKDNQLEVTCLRNR